MEDTGELLFELLHVIGSRLSRRFQLDRRPWWVRMLVWAAFIAALFGLIYLYLHLMLTYY